MKAFEELLEETLIDEANPLPSEGFEARVLGRIEAERMRTSWRRSIFTPGAVAAAVLVGVLMVNSHRSERLNPSVASAEPVPSKAARHDVMIVRTAKEPVSRAPGTAHRWTAPVVQPSRDALPTIAPMAVESLEVEPMQIASLTLTNVLQRGGTR